MEVNLLNLQFLNQTKTFKWFKSVKSVKGFPSHDGTYKQTEIATFFLYIDSVF